MILNINKSINQSKPIEGMGYGLGLVQATIYYMGTGMPQGKGRFFFWGGEGDIARFIFKYGEYPT